MKTYTEEDMVQRISFLKSKIARELKDYAANRQAEAQKGRETPEFAALMVEKYGRGMLDSLRIMSDSFDLAHFDGELSELLDELVATINPEWRETNKRRWASQQVGIVMSDSTTTEVNI